MNKIVLLIFLNFVCSCIVKGQKIDYPLNNRVIINYPDRIVYAYFDVEKRDISISDDRYYYWFSANDIKRTRGGYDGKILHGYYIEYYNNRNLREKGLFKYGLKRGHWKSWYVNGELKDNISYHKGMRNGKFVTYYSNGSIHQRGTYYKEQLNKKYTLYDSTGSVMKSEHYKKGVLVKAKRKKFKEATKNAEPADASKAKVKRRKFLGLFNKEVNAKPAEDPLLNKDKKNTDKNIDKENPNNKENKQLQKKGKEKAKKDKKIKVKKIKKIVPSSSESNSSI